MVFTQDCCGKILLTDSSTVLIWERDPSTAVRLVQVTVYCSPDSSGPLRVRVEGNTVHELAALPGSTLNFSGHQPLRLHVLADQQVPPVFVEATYAIRPTYFLPNTGTALP